MTDNLEEPLFSCSRDGCREECSYPADMLRRHNGKPICECCYDVLPYSEQALDPSDPEETLMWSDLPPFVPAIIATAREVEGLRAALQKCADAMALVTEGNPMGVGKNDKCKHGRFGFEGCESCVDSTLDPALEAARAALEGRGG